MNVPKHEIVFRYRLDVSDEFWRTAYTCRYIKHYSFRICAPNATFVFLCLLKLRYFVQNSITFNKYTIHKNKCYCLIQSVLNLYLPHWATPPFGPGPPLCRDITITLKHTTFGGTLWDEWSSRCRDLFTRQITTLVGQRRPCPWGVSNPQSQQLSGYRHVTYTMRPLVSAFEPILYFNGIVVEEFPFGHCPSPGSENPQTAFYKITLRRDCVHRKFSRDIKIPCQKLPASKSVLFNPLNAELNPICHFLALLGGATIVVVSRLKVKTFLND